MTPALVSFAWAALAVAVLLLWQFLNVRYNSAGNWTALFCTGQNQRVPPELEAGTYRFSATGYDGQMYRYVAHDPLLQRGLAQYVDAPVIRYRRILVPGLAFALAAGRQSYIDAAYIAVVAIFVALGSYWLSRWASLHGFHPAWGLAFALAPATLISSDRMTVDGALTALTVGFAYFVSARSSAKVYLVLVLACLTRETGAFLVAGCCIFELWERRFTRTVIWATACLPALGWYWFLHRRFHVGAIVRGTSFPRWFLHNLGTGIVGRMLHPIRYPFPPAIELLARSLDVAALAGVLCAVIMAVVLLRVRPRNPVPLAGFLFALLAIALANPRYWDLCYSYARVFSPLLVLVALEAIPWKVRPIAWLAAIIPTALVDLRIGLELGSENLRIFRGLLGH